MPSSILLLWSFSSFSSLSFCRLNNHQLSCPFKYLGLRANIHLVWFLYYFFLINGKCLWNFLFFCYLSRSVGYWRIFKKEFLSSDVAVFRDHNSSLYVSLSKYWIILTYSLTCCGTTMAYEIIIYCIYIMT